MQCASPSGRGRRTAAASGGVCPDRTGAKAAEAGNRAARASFSTSWQRTSFATRGLASAPLDARSLLPDVDAKRPVNKPVLGSCLPRSRKTCRTGPKTSAGGALAAARGADSPRQAPPFPAVPRPHPARTMSERMFHVKHLAEERMAAAKRMMAPGVRCGPPSRIRGSGAEAGPRRGSAGREPRMSRALGRRARRSSERKRFVRLARAWL